MPFTIVRNDITRMQVDAIVNAANESLLGGGGVDEAIHRAAGPGLLEECLKLGGCPTGQAKATRGYDLPCRCVIHTVGPVWQGGGHGERALLASCYRNSLALALKLRCASVAFPMISTGVYGYPKAEALRVALDEVASFLMDHEMMVYLVVFSKDAVAVGGQLFSDITAYIDDVYVEAHTDPCRERQRRNFLSSLPQAAAPTLWDAQADAACPDALPAPSAPGELWDGDAPAAALQELLDQVDEGFSRMLLRLIDERGMTDAQCYKRANVDRRLFNKIKNNPDYRPGKQTALAFAIALRLTLPQTRELLMKAGYALSHSSRADIAVEYCIAHGQYDIIEINQVLFQLDLPPLGY